MESSKSPVKKLLRAAVIFSSAIGVLYIFSCWYSVAPGGSDFLYKHISLLLIAYLFLLVLYNGIRLLVNTLIRLFGRGKLSWTELAATALFLVTVFVLTTIAWAIGHIMRDRGYKAIIAHGRPLVAAIRQYEDKTGKPPDRLEQLVPDYLPVLPGTGAGAYPNYEYLTNASPLKYGGNHWVLSVDVSTDDLARDELIYYPNRNYPSEEEVPLVRHFGDWAYLSITRHKENP